MSKNGKANLIKSNGDRVQKPTQDAVETVTALRPEIGEALKESVLKALNVQTTSLNTEGDEKAPSFTEARLRTISKTFKSTEDLIKHLRAKQQGWMAQGAEKIDARVGEFLNWTLSLAPVTNEDGSNIVLKVKTPEGILIDLPTRDAVSGSVRYLLYSMLDMSNAAFLGQAAKIGKNGKRKDGKKSIFESEKRNAQSGQGIGGDENWKVRASANYLVYDGLAGSKFCKAIELIAVCAKFVNNDMPADAQKEFKILTGQMKDDARFSFDPKLIEDLVIARCLGLLVAGARQWQKDLKESQAKELSNIAWLNQKNVEIERLTEDLERMKAFNDSHPELSEKPSELELTPEEMKAVDEDAVAFRRAQGFFRRAIDEMQLADHIAYTDEGLQASINQFADGLISEGEIKIALYSHLREVVSEETLAEIHKSQAVVA